MSVASLADAALVCRSKNAGAFLLTLDVILPDGRTYERTLGALSREAIAARYGVPPERVTVSAWEGMLAIKLTLPRGLPAGSAGDRDVYGCQQHGPLLALLREVPADDPALPIA